MKLSSRNLAFIGFFSIVLFSSFYSESEPSESIVEQTFDESKLILFRIERSDENCAIFYKANTMPQGGFNHTKPFEVFKIDYNSEDQTRLSIPRMAWNSAYSYQILQKRENNYIISLKAFADRKFDIYLTEDKCFALTSINNKIARIQSIYILVNEEMFTPRVEYIQYQGIELKTGKSIYERVKPENLGF